MRFEILHLENDNYGWRLVTDVGSILLPMSDVYLNAEAANDAILAFKAWVQNAKIVMTEPKEKDWVKHAVRTIKETTQMKNYWLDRIKERQQTKEHKKQEDSQEFFRRIQGLVINRKKNHRKFKHS